ncbi:MAG: hypothetical protein K9K79_00325 [Desulfohalobiaceae bacterium]|nr:hypothetical protein [Desulfohalobiaceae bacterium]
MFKKILLLSGFLMLFTACSGMQNPFVPQPDTGSDISMQESQSEPPPEDVNTYFDFEDILIPSDLSLDQDKSIIFQTSQIKAGKLEFHGRVDPVSLFDFFIVNLPQDNWSIKGQFKYGHFLIIAEKPGKFTVLKISEGNLRTTLQLWVTPRLP